MSELNHYEGFKSLANFSMSAEDGTATTHMMPAKDVVDALSALSNITRRTALLCMGRPSPSPADLRDVNVMVSPPAKGSFLLGVAVGVGIRMSWPILLRHTSKPR